jgi:uncharacterized membrane protein YuzA (DUF378 family)
MLNNIPFKFAINGMLTLLGFVLAFHVLVLLQIIPYQIVWGGRLQSVADMQRFEIVSILVNDLIILVILLKSGYIKHSIPMKIINGLMWVIVGLFALNTVGNLFAQTATEMIVFTPMTIVSAILCLRIVTYRGERV